MRFTRGRTQLWNATFSTARLLNSRNEASQAFDPADRSAVNRAEYFGGSVFVTASGTYQPLVRSAAALLLVSI